NMIGGIETKNADIPSNGDVSFVGKGRGYFSHVSADISSYATIFDVTTEIDFFAKTVDVNSTNTQCADAESSGCAENPDALDFSTQETFSYVIGDKVGFRGDVALKADSTFTGIIDARFYGTKAQELGSIFAMRDETGGYYYGAFGGEREGVVVPSVFNTILGNEKVTSNVTISTNHASLTTVADDTFTMNALAVYKDDAIIYTRAPKREWSTYADTAPVTSIVRLTGSVASLTFVAGNVSGVTAYLNDATYTANNADTIDVERGMDFFGFDSNYMAYIGWNLKKNESALDSGSHDLIDNTYSRTGSMIAGIETVVGDMPDFGEQVEFTGKGRGFFSNRTESYTTIFDVTATVDFIGNNVKIKSSGTCEMVANADCADEGAHRKDVLNFSTGFVAIPYISNNISDNVTTTDEEDRTVLSGTLDARFYGYVGAEFGGTFAMSDSTVNSESYYYGAFGAERETLINVAFDTKQIDAPARLNIPYIVSAPDISLYHAIMNIDGTEDRLFTMRALAVNAIDITDYVRAPGEAWNNSDRDKNVELARIENSYASLTIDENGKLSNISIGAKNNLVYTANSSDLNSDTLSGEIDSEFNIKTITISRDASLFGFAATDMVYIDWEISEALLATDTKVNDVEKRHGMMIAGIETDFARIPIINPAGLDSVMFTGKGRGFYGDIAADTGFHTVFDVTAIVDFVDKDVTMSSDNTCEIIENADCGVGGANRKAGLDFSTDGFIYSANAISVDADAGANAGALTGRLDARFYGDGGHKLGGTFALSNADGYYYGAFGTQRLAFISQFNFNSALQNPSGLASVINTEIGKNDSHLSLHAVAISDGTNSFAMNALAVYQDNNTQYVRVPNKDWNTADTNQKVNIGRVSDVGASVTFNADGNISSVTTYLPSNSYINNNAYSVNIASPESGAIMVEENIDIGTPNNAISAVMTLHRGEGFFGFNSYYMAYIDWQVARKFADLGDGTIDKSYDYSGAMLAGIETDILPSTGTFDFTGKGRGFYHNSKTGIGGQTRYDVTANVVFGSGNVTINSSGTVRCDDAEDISTCSSNHNIGEFSTGSSPISYTGNNMSDIVTVNIGSNNLTGTLDARFYGEVAQELGGTFAMSDNTYYYYGAFGTQRINTSFENVGTTFLGTPTNFNQHSLTGFNDASRAGTTGNALPTTSTVLITRYNDKRITTEKITDAVAEFDFNASHKISSFKLYFDDKKYTFDPHPFQLYDYQAFSNSASVVNGDAPDELKIIRKDLTDYMALVEWKIGKFVSYDAYGYTITGWETDGGDISITGIANFTGKGEGHYYSASNDDAAYFDVIATVNFNNNNVSLISTNTCNTAIANDCKQAINQRPHLDFTGILSYSAGMNEITGDVATVGDGYTNLTGTAD
ncbi:MAG: hypothetical protein K0U45_01455, partial [Alphaproteobacteria bacterium]|nr:hypothetical protein [Alphaproteobacteria bacterium]